MVDDGAGRVGARKRGIRSALDLDGSKVGNLGIGPLESRTPVATLAREPGGVGRRSVSVGGGSAGGVVPGAGFGRIVSLACSFGSCSRSRPLLVKMHRRRADREELRLVRSELWMRVGDVS